MLSEQVMFAHSPQMTDWLFNPRVGLGTLQLFETDERLFPSKEGSSLTGFF